MGNIRENENNNKRPVIRYLVCLLVVVTIITAAVLSRYVISLSGENSARAAKFEYEIAVEQNDRDPEELAENTAGRAFTPGFFSSTSITGNADFDLSVYATAKLSEAGQCKFDDVARVIDVTFTNKSEVMVDAAVVSMTDISDTGIVWCVFDEDDGAYSGYDDILTKLGYPDGSYAANYQLLIDDLNDVNADTLAIWNDKVIAPNGAERTLTIVFWAEHDAATAASWNFVSELTQTIEIDYTVAQID